MAYVHARHTHNVKMGRYTLSPALSFKVYGLDRPLEPVPTPLTVVLVYPYRYLDDIFRQIFSFENRAVGGD